MPVSARAYGQMPQALANREGDFDTDTVKVMLCTSAYVPDVDTHRYRSHITNEVSGTGYTAGGATLTGKVSSYDPATNITKLTAGNVSWPNSTITARYAVFYIDTGTPATSPLLCYWDFGGDFASNNGAFDLTIHASGLITFQTA